MLSHFSWVSLPLDGLKPTRLLCLWDFPSKNTGVGCYALLQGIFPTQEPTPVLPGKFHQRSLVAYSPRGCKELDMTLGLLTWLMTWTWMTNIFSFHTLHKNRKGQTAENWETLLKIPAEDASHLDHPIPTTPPGDTVRLRNRGEAMVLGWSPLNDQKLSQLVINGAILLPGK